MIRLIKNEFVKIFKKKSFYIVMLVTLIFIVGYNIIMRNISNSENINYYGNLDEQIDYVEKDLQELDPLKESDKSQYIDYKSSLETYKLMKKYGVNSWQFSIVQSKVNPYLRELATFDTEKNKDEVAYKKTLEKCNELISKLDKEDWQFFAKSDLEEAEKQLKEQNKIIKESKSDKEIAEANKMIKHLQVQKQTLEWRLEKNISYESSYYNRLIDNYYNSSINIIDFEAGGGKTESTLMKQDYYDDLERANKARYDIENGTRTQDESNARGMLVNFFSHYEIFIVIIIVMIAGTIVSEEFNKGTIKLLLVRPYKRATILTSKFITCLIMVAIIIISIMLMQFIVGGIIFGFDSFGTPTIEYDFNAHEIQEMNIASYMLIQTIGKLPIYVLLMTLSFALSTLFNNSAVAITLTLLGYMGSSMINMIGLQMDLDWIRYFVTPNWDLTQHFFGALPMYEGTTIEFSIVINAIYFIIMLIPTYIVFKKRNIKNI